MKRMKIFYHILVIFFIEIFCKVFFMYMRVNFSLYLNRKMEKKLEIEFC